MPRPHQPYIAEPNRSAPGVVATVRTIDVPQSAIPPSFPYRRPRSDIEQGRTTIGWLEFFSDNAPDPALARPGDVWIQSGRGRLPAGVFLCYSPEGNAWTPWEGMDAVHTNNPPVGVHPFLSDEKSHLRKRHYYFIFSGIHFRWSSYNSMLGVTSRWRAGQMPGAQMMQDFLKQHEPGSVPFTSPQENVAQWLRLYRGPTTYSPRKRALPESDDMPKASASAPAHAPAKRQKVVASGPDDGLEASAVKPLSASALAAQSSRPLIMLSTGVLPPPTRSSPRQPPASAPPRPEGPETTVDIDPYGMDGITQKGKIIYENDTPLVMATRCERCQKAGFTPCTGLPGKNCGRCRSMRQACSHGSVLDASDLPESGSVQPPLAEVRQTTSKGPSPTKNTPKTKAASAKKPPPKKTATKAKKPEKLETAPAIGMKRRLRSSMPAVKSKPKPRPRAMTSSSSESEPSEEEESDEEKQKSAEAEPDDMAVDASEDEDAVELLMEPPADEPEDEAVDNKSVHGGGPRDSVATTAVNTASSASGTGAPPVPSYTLPSGTSYTVPPVAENSAPATFVNPFSLSPAFLPNTANTAEASAANAVTPAANTVATPAATPANIADTEQPRTEVGDAVNFDALNETRFLRMALMGVQTLELGLKGAMSGLKLVEQGLKGAIEAKELGQQRLRGG